MPKLASHDVWLAHLDKLLEFRRSSEQPDLLNAEDVREIALEIGLTEDDLRAAELAADRAHKRGEAYLERALWDDAIGELTEAAALTPANIEVLSSLAKGYLGRYRAEGETQDRDAALRLAKSCVDFDPTHSASYDLISEVEREQEAKRRGFRPRHLALGLVAMGCVGIGIGLYLRSAPSDRMAAPRTMNATPTGTVLTVTPRSRDTTEEAKCQSGMRFEHDRGCFQPTVVVEPGVGLQGIVVGRSKPEDVLAALGRDAKVSKHSDGQVFKISYDYDADGQYEPSRSANHVRPNGFYFKRDVLERISVGVYQQDLRTIGGLHTRSTLAELYTVLGKPDALVPGKPLDKYIYRRRGIEFWVNREKRAVNSFHVRAPQSLERTE